MPHTSHEDDWLASPTMPPAVFTCPSDAGPSRSQVMPANDLFGSLAELTVASLVHPVVWQRAQEYEAPALATQMPPLATQPAEVLLEVQVPPLSWQSYLFVYATLLHAPESGML